MIHVGKKVKEVLDTKAISVTSFAKKINKSRSVVYNIFERESIDSVLLYKISEVLEFNFFNLFQFEESQNKVAEPIISYGEDWKTKYLEVLEKYNDLLEKKVEVYFRSKD
jgi:hypothetical protein